MKPFKQLSRTSDNELVNDSFYPGNKKNIKSISKKKIYSYNT